MLEKEELKFVQAATGELFVMITGMSRMLKLFAGSWDTIHLVRPLTNAQAT